MLTALNDPVVSQSLTNAKAACLSGNTRQVTVNGNVRTIPAVWPSPQYWRDSWIYFIMLDRFNNRRRLPRAAGTGAQANVREVRSRESLTNWITSRASGAERHCARLNHSGRVFDYVIGGQAKDTIADRQILDAPLGAEPPVQWLNGFGQPRSDWQNGFPPGTQLSADDAVYPDELGNRLFFRRRGSKLDDSVPRDADGRPLANAFVRGDFGTMRQLVVEYDATAPGQEQIRKALGKTPVLSVLVWSFNRVWWRSRV